MEWWSHEGKGQNGRCWLCNTLKQYVFSLHGSLMRRYASITLDNRWCRWWRVAILAPSRCMDHCVYHLPMWPSKMKLRYYDVLLKSMVLKSLPVCIVLASVFGVISDQHVHIITMIDMSIQYTNNSHLRCWELGLWFLICSFICLNQNPYDKAHKNVYHFARRWC